MSLYIGIVRHLYNLFMKICSLFRMYQTWTDKLNLLYFEIRNHHIYFRLIGQEDV